MTDPPVAVGLLTAHELGLLGKSFKRYLPLPTDDTFADILSKFDALSDEEATLDRADGLPSASGNTVERA